MTDKITITPGGLALHIKISCDLDHHNSRKLRDILDRVIFEHRPSVLVFDLSEVLFIDSAGIGLVMGRCSSCGAIGGTVQIVGLKEYLEKIARVGGLWRVRNLTIVKKPPDCYPYEDLD